MSYPTIKIDQKKVILLSGFERKHGVKRSLVIKSIAQLELAAKKHGDAVAFGYVCGQVDAGRVKRGRPTVPSGRPVCLNPIPPA